MEVSNTNTNITDGSQKTQIFGIDNSSNQRQLKTDSNGILVSSDKLSLMTSDFNDIIVKDIVGTISSGFSLNQNKRNFWDLNENGEVVLTTNAPLYVVSDDSNDKDGFSGARTVSVEYIYKDSSGNLQRETQEVVLNGTTLTTMNVNGVAIVSATVISAGINKANMGNLSFQAQTVGGSAPAYQTLNYMSVGMNITKLFIGIPKHQEYLYITELYYNCVSEFKLKIKINKVEISTGIKQVLFEEMVDNNVNSKIDCSIKIVGGTHYILGEIEPIETVTGTNQHFRLSASGIYYS